MVGKVGDIPFTGGNQRVRDQILVILSEDFPLTPKTLFTRVSKQGMEVSYQAVHKVIQQLISEGILEKKTNGVQLSENWIHRVRDYAFTVDTVYTKGKKYKIPASFDKPFTITFDDFSEYIVWTAEALRDGKFTGGKPEPVFGLFRHALWPLRFNFMDFELLRQMTSKCYTQGVCAGDTPFDRWISTHYLLGGLKRYRTGIKIKLSEDLFTNGDIIIRAKYSPETIKYIDQVYSKIGDMKQLFEYYFMKTNLKESTHIEMTIERNPTMARIIQNQILQYLGEKKA
jgi:DNA-binding Lrp family transcriptional regulator